MFPTYSRAERTADAFVHVAGIVLCICGAIALHFAAIGRIPLRELAGLSVYSAGMIGMFTASAGYNLVDRPSLKELMRRVDHSLIFIMIAGSYTPFALKIGGGVGMIILAGVWLIAGLGIGLKLLFPRKFDRVSIALYLAQGWCVLLAMGPLMDTLSDASFNLLLLGGAVYTAGVIFHLLERMPFNNAIWHVFVLGGAALQYASIYAAIIP